MALSGISFALQNFRFTLIAIFSFPRLAARTPLPFRVKGKAAKGKNC
jgi:hypothetical protein